MKTPFTVIMNPNERCRITFKLSLTKRILAWIMNDMNPAQPLSIVITTQASDENPTTTIVVDDKHFNGFKIENIS